MPRTAVASTGTDSSARGAKAWPRIAANAIARTIQIATAKLMKPRGNGLWPDNPTTIAGPLLNATGHVTERHARMHRTIPSATAIPTVGL
jgi:hypothetical protein